MARPTKQGIDYFPLDVHLDDKWRFVQIKFGLEGFAIVVRMLQKIYSEEGYWCRWGEDECILFSDEIKADFQTVDNVVKECLSRGIFDPGMFENHGILTSRGIQKRFREATRRRRNSDWITDYLLIDDIISKDCKHNDGNNGVNDDNNPGNKGVIDGKNPDNDRVNDNNKSVNDDKNNSEPDPDKRVIDGNNRVIDDNNPDKEGVIDGKSTQSKVKESKVTISREIKNFTVEFQKYVLAEKGKLAPKVTDRLIRNGCDTIEKLIRIDGFTFEYIKSALRWAVKDDFWSNQVRSLAKLRARQPNDTTKFQNLLVKYEASKNAGQSKGNKHPASKEITLEFLEEIMS